MERRMKNAVENLHSLQTGLLTMRQIFPLTKKLQSVIRIKSATSSRTIFYPDDNESVAINAEHKQSDNETEETENKKSVGTEDQNQPDILDITDMQTFSRLGYGYCPRSENTKDNIFQPDTKSNQNNAVLKQFLPSNVIFIPKIEVRSNWLSCEQKQTYEESMATSYGLEADVKLVVNGSANGRWIKGKSTGRDCSEISYIYEIRVGKYRLNNPPENQILKDFMEILKNLPAEYCHMTASAFNQFFSKWGTHFIIEQYIGGSIKVNCVVNTMHISADAQRKLTGKIENVFKNLVVLAPSAELTNAGRSFTEREMAQHSLLITGGSAQGNVFSFADMSSAAVNDWVKSVKQNPVELQHSSKLYPYYNLVNSESLREATLGYLDGSLYNAIEGMKKYRSIFANPQMETSEEEVPKQKKVCYSQTILKHLKRFS